MSSSPPLGFGAAALGASGFGWGTPAIANSSTKAFLVQADGTRGDCEALDTTTGDYLLDANGYPVGWDSTSQKVYLALRTKLGSAAVQTVGIDLPQGTITDDIVNRIKLAVAAALKALTDAGEVELVSVAVNRTGTSAVRTVVQWRALPDGAVQSTFV